MILNKLNQILQELSNIEDDSSLIKDTIDLINQLVAQNESLKRQILDLAVEFEME